ncbi:hypothetical protein Patl1_18423 [Pistacia atlantica]|uniref:Uncharacterized protein n=1 Tax=Pistacia atlantica TaxID=434234 RepID=A0ACC1BZ55_9ROSI|nr:hypothetical protein Patl1_18423 [Pistacia atlantica]
MDYTNRIFFSWRPLELLTNFNHRREAAFFCSRSCFSSKIDLPNNSTTSPQRHSVDNIHKLEKELLPMLRPDVNYLVSFQKHLG